MHNKQLITTNRILLGLVMLIPGLTKLFVMGPEGFSGMLGAIPLVSLTPLFWAWIVTLAEIGFGIAIIANYKTEYSKIPPMIILAVAILFIQIKWSAIGTTSWGQVFTHLALVSNYALLGNKK